jgi:hypothetical protein
LRAVNSSFAQAGCVETANANAKTHRLANRPAIPISIFTSSYFFCLIDRTTAEPFTRLLAEQRAGELPSEQIVKPATVMSGETRQV